MACIGLSSKSCAVIGVPIYLRRVSQGISGIAQRKPRQLSCTMGNGALLWSQCRGIDHHFKLIWATLSYLTFLWWHQSTFRLVRDFLGTLCSSIKQIKAPYILIGNNTLLCKQCRGIEPHLSGRGKFHGLSQVAAGSWGTFSSYGRGSH